MDLEFATYFNELEDSAKTEIIDEAGIFAFNVNMAYSTAIGTEAKNLPKRYRELSEEELVKVREAIEKHFISDVDPEESHEMWLNSKAELGWTYGEEKNEELKTHPCIMPYNDLPAEQKVKDVLFKESIRSFAEFMTRVFKHPRNN